MLTMQHTENQCKIKKATFFKCDFYFEYLNLQVL